MRSYRGSSKAFLRRRSPFALLFLAIPSYKLYAVGIELDWLCPPSLV